MSRRSPENGMHAWVEERLSAYMDDQLAPNERARLDEHLHGCARCQSNLASLKWTASLLKQAPAPRLPRSFTLPMPEKKSPAFNFGFAALRFATALATLLLFVIVGADLILNLSGAPAPVQMRAPAAQEFAAPTQQSIALVPQATTAPTVAAPPTAQPAAAVQSPAAPPPAPLQPVVGRAMDTVTPSTADKAQSAAQGSPPAPTRALPVSLPATPTSIPTLQPSPIATATSIARARVEPTRAPQPTLPPPQIYRVGPFSYRVAEIGLLALVIVLGALTIWISRKR